MSEENTIRVKLYRNGTVVQELDDGTTRVLDSDTDWARFDAITDEDAEYNALMDPDFEPFLTDEDREKIKKLPDPKRIRRKLRKSSIRCEEYAWVGCLRARVCIRNR